MLLLCGCSLTAPYRSRAPLPMQVAYADAINASIAATGIPPDSEADRSRRNQILNQLVFLADAEYATYEESIYVSDASLNTAADIVTLGLTGAAALLSSGGSLVATTVLAGTATALNGSRLAVASNWFEQHGRVALVATMRGLRAEQALMLAAGMAQSAADYPLSRGLIDVQAYVGAGNVVSALQAITQSSISGLARSTAALQAKKEGQ